MPVNERGNEPGNERGHTPANGTTPIVRWTIGDVHSSGFEALRLSMWGMYRLLGARAGYVVCLNSMDLRRAQRLTGPLPPDTVWRIVTHDDIPPFIRAHLDGHMAEGVGWKFAPLRLSDDRPELALDNDCILWEMPAALQRWLSGPATTATARATAMAEDVRACFGQFASRCGDRPMNSGIRAVPAGFDLERRLRAVLADVPVIMTSELDEQGLQVAALSLDHPPDLVSIDEVSICSPIPPHLPHLRRCGAHFVGLNARSLPWSYEGRPAVAHIPDHWHRWRDTVAHRVGCSERASQL